MRTSIKIAFGFLIGCAVLWGQGTAQINGTVRDASGLAVPGAEVKATQTATGAIRTVTSGADGAYIFSNLPIGPYQVEVSKDGFTKYLQAGILLQVASNPTVDVALKVGSVAEQVLVEADASLVEARSTGIGQVIDNVRVLEMPLNGRNPQELIILSGAAVGGGNQATARTWPTDYISVGGGLNDSLTYLLDGGTHNDPYSNANLPLPFPDALQEFKVETSAVPAQYGQHSAGAVNGVTKSGTNEFHGDLFEFLRNGVMNARNTFLPQRDGLKRNQFGGVLGAPILKNKLFGFFGYQGTIQRSAATVVTGNVPSQQMLTGDFTTYASSTCQGTRPVSLRAPFVNNQMSPALFSPAAVTLANKWLPKTNDPCGFVTTGRGDSSDEKMFVSRGDYTVTEKHTLFGRYQRGILATPNNYNGSNILSLNIPDYNRSFHSFVFGDTYLISPTTISSFRGTFMRTVNAKTLAQDFFSFGDLGVKGLYFPPDSKHYVRLTVAGAFNIDVSAPGVTNSMVEQYSEDLTVVRGSHQIGYGVDYIHTNMNYIAGTFTSGRFAFTAANTGLGLGDLMAGKPNEWRQDQKAAQYLRQNYVGLYLQDTWKATSRFTVSAGIRWEPFLWPYDVRSPSARFQQDWFQQGLRSSVYTNAPAGVLFPGDPGVADVGNSENETRWMHFAPRLGLAWDPKGDGLTVIRAAYGIFYDYPHLNGFGGLRNTPPRGNVIQIPTPVGGFDDPWLGYPGGNPIPLAVTKDVVFPTQGVYTIIPQDTKTSYINSWNLSAQHQFGKDWLIAGNYIGSHVVHQLFEYEGNPGVYIPGNNCVLNGTFVSGPCSTAANVASRRLLTLLNPAQGKYFSNVVIVDDGGTRGYNGMILSVQRRRSHGITIQGNYTYSHCIDTGYTDVIQTNGNQTLDRRAADRGNCELDRRHNFNLSTVYETPRFSNRAVRMFASEWRISGIARVLSGAVLAMGSGLDNARTGTLFTGLGADQRPDQVLADPYMPNKGQSAGWLNPAAFAQPAVGTYGNLGRDNIYGPGSVRFDLGVVRAFPIWEKKTLEVRGEAFNFVNHPILCGANSGQQGTPPCMSTTFSDSLFGKIVAAGDPRILQVAMKFVF